MMLSYTSNPWLKLIDPSTALILISALVTIAYGSFRSLTIPGSSSYSSHTLDTETSIDWRMAVMLPIIGSGMLVLLFYFNIYYVLLVIFCISSLYTISYLVLPLIEAISIHFWKDSNIKVPVINRTISLDVVIALLIASSAIAIWLTTRHWSITDLLALTTGVAFVALIRLPNFKVALIILSLFFCYDFFWVYLSPLLFQKNVMVEVANKVSPFQSSNSTSIPLPIVIRIPLIFQPYTNTLGMGDIALPGMYLSYLFRFDAHQKSWASLELNEIHSSLADPEDFNRDFIIGDTDNSNNLKATKTPAAATHDFDVESESNTFKCWLGKLCPWNIRLGYFVLGLLGYSIGFVAAIITGTATNSAQPALVFLVPGIFLPTLLKAWKDGDLEKLWQGIPVKQQLSDAELDEIAFDEDINNTGGEGQGGGQLSGENNNYDEGGDQHSPLDAPK